MTSLTIRDMTTSNDTNDFLSVTLDSTPFLLAYTIPLLIVSFVITFGGAFLTVDRTRTFAPSGTLNESSPAKSHSTVIPRNLYLFFEGGIGGIATGYAFGIHTSTFLSLLIPSVTTSAPLGPKSFTATWLLSGIVTGIVAGRWKYAAFAIAGVTGFATFATALSVMLHPNLITRIAVMATFTVVGTIFCLVPLPRFSHFPLRLATSATGTFGIVLCIALMGHIHAWSNVWDRYWISDSSEWGTSKEKGLSSAYCIILTLGIACDFLLHRRFGENPDERWDRYLADYSTHLPTEADRAGSFQPPASIWDRILASAHGFHPANPTVPGEIDIDAKYPPPEYSPGKLYRNRGSTEKHLLPNLSAPPPRGAFLRRDRKHRPPPRLFGGRTRTEIKFNSIHDEDSDDEQNGKQMTDGADVISDHEQDIAAAWRPNASIVENKQPSNAHAQPLDEGKRHSDWVSFWRDVRQTAGGDT